MNPLYQLDQEAFRAIHVGMHRDWLDPIMVAITDSGRGEFKFGILVVLLFIVRYRSHAAMALSAGLASGIVGQAIKKLLERDRPSNFSWAEPIPSYVERLMDQHAPMASNSFPSGHAVSSFGIAVAIAWAVRKTEHAWLGWTLVGWASLVALSRVYVGVHFPSDVIAGAAIGTVAGTLFYQWWRSRGWLAAPTEDEG